MMAALLAALAPWAPACGGAQEGGQPPVATLGATVKAEQSFRPLMRRWELGTREERQALEGELRSFCGAFPDDDLRAMAMVVRGWNALERGELAEARRLVRDAHLGHPGVPRDLASLVVGAAERRSGEPAKALRTLSPLLHKMLDDFATTLLNAELVQAAIGAKQWMAAVRYMEVWQREAQLGDETKVAARIAELLARVPKEQLMSALDQRRRDGTIESGRETAKRIAQQLAIYIVEGHDALAARKLLDLYGPLLGSYGEAVARLAADTVRGRVISRTVGLLSALSSSAHRRRSADVAVGMAFGLGLPGSGARLVSRDGGDSSASVRQAMTELASEGAAVIVAALDANHSAAVAKFADDNSLPVMLLTPPAQPFRSPFVFQLGHHPQSTVGVLADELDASGAAPTAGFGAPLVAADGKGPQLGLAFERPCDALPTVAELRTRNIRSLVLLDGAYCGRQVLALADAIRAPLGLGLGVPLVEKPRLRVLSAGVFPVDEKNADPRLRGWLASGRRAPSWWTALGHDAAVLAYGAVKGLQRSGTDDDEVKARRVEATSALAAAENTLWTSDVKGFGPDQAVRRVVTVRK
jgi:hypothetical protein